MVRTGPNDRIKAAVVTALLQGLLAYAFLFGMKVPVPVAAPEPLSVISIIPEKSPEPVVPPPERSQLPEGEAAPPNIRSNATPVVAPERVIPLPVPSPVVAAPVADVGSDPTQGAADVPGPGTGAGGEGEGRGGGGYGDGDGGGGRGTPPRLIKGRIRDSDYPDSARGRLAGGVVTVLYTVAVSGRVTDCRIERSSGNGDLDEATCRLIMERFRYRPSLDRNGRPVQAKMISDHYWIVDESEARLERDRR